MSRWRRIHSSLHAAGQCFAFQKFVRISVRGFANQDRLIGHQKINCIKILTPKK